MRNKGKAHVPEQPSLWPPWRPERDRWLVHQGAAHRRTNSARCDHTCRTGGPMANDLKCAARLPEYQTLEFYKVCPVCIKQTEEQCVPAAVWTQRVLDTHSAVVLNEAGLYLVTGAEKVCGGLSRPVLVNTTEIRMCSRPHRQANDLTPVLSFSWSSEEFKVSPYRWWSCVWGCQPWPPPE